MVESAAGHGRQNSNQINIFPLGCGQLQLSTEHFPHTHTGKNKQNRLAFLSKSNCLSAGWLGLLKRLDSAHLQGRRIAKRRVGGEIEVHGPQGDGVRQEFRHRGARRAVRNSQAADVLAAWEAMGWAVGRGGNGNTHPPHSPAPGCSLGIPFPLGGRGVPLPPVCTGGARHTSQGFQRREAGGAREAEVAVAQQRPQPCTRPGARSEPKPLTRGGGGWGGTAQVNMELVRHVNESKSVRNPHVAVDGRAWQGQRGSLQHAALAGLQKVGDQRQEVVWQRGESAWAEGPWALRNAPPRPAVPPPHLEALQKGGGVPQRGNHVKALGHRRNS